METALCTIAFFSSQAGIGYGVLAAGVRDRGVKPRLTLNALEYFSYDDLRSVLVWLVNTRGVTHRIVLEGTATIHAPEAVADE